MRGADGDDRVRPGGQQLAHQARHRIRLADTPVEDEVAAFDEAKLRKLRQGYFAGQGFADRRIRNVPETVDPIGSLGEHRHRARDQRPGCGRTAKT